MALLKVRNLQKSFRNGNKAVTVLKDINLEVEAGSKLAIVGPSGSGKTTLLNILGTIDRPDAGEILWEGSPLNWDDERELATLRMEKLGFVFQFYYLMPELNVEENIILPGLMAAWEHSRLTERLEELLEALNLQEKRKAKIYTLSGGERQKVAIARAVFLRPKLLLADEPTGNLDPESTKEVLKIFLELNATQGVTLILVTHNLELAQKMDKIYLLKEGVLVEYREPL
uniref:ABC transporter ATP-binding protein n=1 Tax=Caldimicrobium thiodismutans TaxID=1653476 RepID=A0A832LXT6_9BACT